jgi:hypothetical protein
LDKKCFKLGKLLAYDGYDLMARFIANESHGENIADEIDRGEKPGPVV